MNYCKDCKFFATTALTQSSGGQCKRFPPVIISEERKDGYGNAYTEASPQQPWVYPTDWCGEFKEQAK